MERPREPGSGASGYAEAYRRAGVDLDRGAEVVRRVAELVRGTHGPEVLRGIGAFAGAIRLPDGLDDPVLFASADGVGTKLLLAQAHGRLEVAGWDLVAMNVNDLAAEGAQPLFFLDYVAMGRLDPDAIERLIAGMVDALREVGAVLLGAKPPNFRECFRKAPSSLRGLRWASPPSLPRASGAGRRRPPSGPCEFRVSRKRLQPSSRPPRPRPGPLHPRRAPHPDAALRSPGRGGLCRGRQGRRAHHRRGFPENLARVFPSTLAAEVAVEAWEVPEIFRRAQAAANLDDREAYAVWNQGIGFVFVVAPERLGDVRRALEDLGEHPVVLGRLVEQGQGGEGGAVRFRYGGHLPA